MVECFIFAIGIILAFFINISPGSMAKYSLTDKSSDK